MYLKKLADSPEMHAFGCVTRGISILDWYGTIGFPASPRRNGHAAPVPEAHRLQPRRERLARIEFRSAATRGLHPAAQGGNRRLDPAGAPDLAMVRAAHRFTPI